jgi:membrane-associated protease RseP (regulator of RpoE activity)
MLNLDMIGRSRGELMVGGVGTAAQFRPILEEIDRASPLKLNLAETASGPSDHLAFALKRIPVLFFFSGLHSDYHRPSDDWEKVDLARTRQVLKVVQDVVQQLDALEEDLQYVDLGIDLPGVPRTVNSEDRPYFGSIPDLGHEGLGLRFAQIQEESPAEKAGLLAGDVLFEFDGRRIDNLYDFTFVLRELQPGDVVNAVVRRGGRRLVVPVVLANWPWD